VCEDKGQQLTRSRPNHKNDNCFVEERNGHIVRRWVGYDRFDTAEVVTALNAVYDVLTQYLNHFVASRRIDRFPRPYRRGTYHTSFACPLSSFPCSAT